MEIPFSQEGGSVDPSNLIEFKPGSQSASIEVRRGHKWSAKCRHDSILIDDRERTIECKDCGKFVDPVQYLIEFAYDRKRFQDQIDDWKKLATERDSKKFDDDCRRKARCFDARPGPDNPQAMDAWDAFAKYFSSADFRMEKSRSASGGWAAYQRNNSMVSVGYVRDKLAEAGGE